MKFFHEVQQYPADIEVHAREFYDINFPAHWHNDIEIILVTTGVLEVGFNLDTYHLTAGEMLLISGGNIHYYNTETESRGIMLLFTPAVLLNIRSDAAFSVPLLIKGEKVRFFADIFHSIQAELRNKEPAYKNFVGSYLSLLASWITRNRTPQSIIKKSVVSLKKIQLLFEYIEENYQNSISLEKGADILNYSKWHFSRYFKSLTGTTFSKYLNIIRIEAAKNMLTTNDDKIIEIALSCGFETVRTFNREFKSFTGMTPKEYRRRPEARVVSGFGAG